LKMSRQQHNTSAPRQDTGSRIPKPPERPLPPYMRFSKKIWPKLRLENPDIQLWEISKKVSLLWNELTASEKVLYQEEFEAEKVEYEKQIRHYTQSHSQFISLKTRATKNSFEKGVSAPVTSRKGAAEQNFSGVVIQPVDDDDLSEMSAKRLSALRYDRNNRLMLDLFSSSYLPDQRSMVYQQRIEHLRKQSTSLEQHQKKLNEELQRLEDSFNRRKRAIVSSTEMFNEALKKICDEKPMIDHDSYEKKIV